MSQQSFPAAYLRGIELFNHGEYFDAHEVWEDPWRATRGTERIFYQALIQAAVALEHLRRNNPKSAATVWRNCQSKFLAVPDFFMGVDIRSFLLEVETALQPALDPDAGSSEFSARNAPTIRLLSR